MKIQHLTLTLPLTLLAASAPMLAATCAEIGSTALPNARIDAANVVAPGAFLPPGAANGKGGGGAAYQGLPEFCRVTATLTPSSDSDIKIEVWLPTSGWNEKYQAVGNGGWAGTVSYTAMAAALERGYATSSTDTGHVGGRGMFALGHPEKLIDYAWRSEHEMVLKSKLLIQAFYGQPARYSYWVGCSTGGKQGLTAAQRFPDDFDGIIAGAPANYMIHLHAWSIWVNQAVNRVPGAFLEREHLEVLHNAVLETCDQLDGVRDGVLEDPTRCNFDPSKVQCRTSSTTGCLTPTQVTAARQIYSPTKNARTGEVIFPPLQPGSEMAWGALAGRTPVDVAADTFRYVVFKDADWDAMTLNFDSDIALADEIDNGLNNAINPDLSHFFEENGKLLMYHGWNDQLIAPENSINYYNSVAQRLGGVDEIEDSMRLFMAPGMAHCRGGDGPDTFDAMTLMEQWVENGQTPQVMQASHAAAGQVDRTRPLCAYPQVAVYDGSGSTDQAANFSCQTP